MIPSPNELTYFLAVADLLNLTRASERLGISQPSLTLAMRRLEDTVGTELLIRHKRGVTLTKAGKQLLVYARKLIQNWENIKTETLASIHEIQGSFTLGCHPSVAIYTLPYFLGSLLEKYPKLEIKLKHDLSRKISEFVINHSVDIGIIVNPVRHPDLVIKKLCDDRITLWQGAVKYSIQDINSQRTLLLCDTDLLQTQDILKKLKKSGINFDRILPTNNLELIADLTANGCGIGILPARIAKTKNLTPIAKAPFYEDEICLVYHGENRDIKAIQVIATAIKNSMV